METVKAFTQALKAKITTHLQEGDLKHVNEITANLFVGSTASFMGLIMIVVWLANEVGVFTIAKPLMRIAALICLVLSLGLSMLNKKFRGEADWLKYALSVGLVVECGALLSILGHNVTLLTVLPAILSIRYFDEKFSLRICVICAVVFLVATLICSTLGVVNLNIVQLPVGTELHITEKLRTAIQSSGFDRREYAINYLRHDYAPKAIIFLLLAGTAIHVAKRGRQMLELQDSITKKSSRIETELDLATQIQADMLPCTLPAFPDHEHLKLKAVNYPAKEVGGDFYDYFRVDEDHVAVVMADVSGKGVGAALFMMISKTVIKNQLQMGLSPAKAMTNANEQLCENNTAGLFVTVWAGVYEVSTGRLTYVNAGHNPPVVIKKDSASAYHKGKTGLVLAGMDGIVYKEAELQLQSGDELFLYTDGVTEATNKNDELFGEDRLLACLETHRDRETEEQLSAVMDAISSFTAGAEQFDDITMLCLRIR